MNHMPWQSGKEQEEGREEEEDYSVGVPCE